MLRVLLWTLVVVYTFLLPYLIVVYNAIVKHSSAAIAGKIPLTVIIVMGVVFSIVVLALKKNIKTLILLIPCTIIAWILCPLIILIIMHGLVMLAIANGLAFL